MLNHEEIRLFVAGSQSITDPKYIKKYIDQWFLDTFKSNKPIVNGKGIKIKMKTGGAKGVDKVSEKIMRKYYRDYVKVLPPLKPDYHEINPKTKKKVHWKQAPIIRNEKNVNWCTHSCNIWDGKSSGTKITIKFAIDHKKNVKIYPRKYISTFSISRNLSAFGINSL